MFQLEDYMMYFMHSHMLSFERAKGMGAKEANNSMNRDSHTCTHLWKGTGPSVVCVIVMILLSTTISSRWS